MPPQPVEIDALTMACSSFPSAPNPFPKFPKYQGAVCQLSGGGTSLLNYLIDSNKFNNTKIKLNAKITSLDFSENLVEVQLGSGEIIHSRKISLTQGSDVPILGGNDPILGRSDSFMNYTVFVLLENSNAKYRFVHLNNHPLVREFQDITSFIPSLKKRNQQLWLFKLSRLYGENTQSLFNLSNILSDFAKFGIVSNKNHPIKFSIQNYLNRRLPENLIRIIMKNAGGKAQVLPFISTNSPLKNSKQRYGASQDLSIIFSSEEFFHCLLEV